MPKPGLFRVLDEPAIDKHERLSKPPALPKWIIISLLCLILALEIVSTTIYPSLSARFLIPISAILLSVILLRQDHPGHVHTLWYLFFLITYCGIGIYYYLDSATGEGLLKTALTRALEMSSDTRNEVILLSTVVGAVVIPQILSFLISGLSGCGTPPILVLRSTQMAILSLIKFFCVFSALEMSAFLFQIYQYYANFVEDITKTVSHASYSVWLLAVSFLLSVCYYESRKLFHKMGANIFETKFLRRVTAYMTRYKA
jgi:hypothetical protein